MGFMMRSTTALYDAQQRAWRTFSERQRDAIRAAYPDTGGSEHLLHNWYVCSRDVSVSEAASALRAALWARWDRVKAWYKREYDRAEHARHIAADQVGAYLWCERCQNAIGMHVEHYYGERGERFYRVVPLAS